MAIPIVTLFNPHDRSGKTFLTYHLAWIFADMGIRILAVDLDPNAGLTAAFLEEGRIVDLWMGEEKPTTVSQGLARLREAGDIPSLSIEEIGEGLGLVPGHRSLWLWEEEFGLAWGHGDAPSTALLRLLRAAAEAYSAEIVLLDLASNLGAINHNALQATDFHVLPVLADPFSSQTLLYAGAVLRRWRKQSTGMEPAGYVVLQAGIRLDLQRREPTSLSELRRIYREVFLGKPDEGPPLAEDPGCLGVLPDLQGLASIAREARKPIFHLKPADGAGSSHLKAAQKAYDLFKQLALQIARRVGVEVQA
jgi:cellulose biosynthesis protein BcsQ